jgi:hypothetical protein
VLHGTVGDMTRTHTHTNHLPTDMLERFRSRAEKLDIDNTYFDEDLAELRLVGYLAAAVPQTWAAGGSTWPSWRRASGGSPAMRRPPRWP